MQNNKQGEKRCQIWYVSHKDDPDKEIRIDNLKEWSDKNNINRRRIYAISNPKNENYGHYVKGWRARKESDDWGPTFVDGRTTSKKRFRGFKEKTWTLINGKRTWIISPTF